MTLSIENVSAGYGRNPVISGIDLQVASGRVCALMGRNGSGKTTLLRCINGVLPLLEGRIQVMGREIQTLGREKIARMISVVPQVSFSPFSFSCVDMVLMAGASRIKAWSAPSVKEKQKALEVMAETGIVHMAQRAFNSISGGERQLVMLARGLFQDTPVMLLDEPTSHLDFANQHKIMALMRTLAGKRGMTVVITLHDPNLTHYYCDDVILIHEGGVAARGETLATLTDDILSKVLG
ncbi:MAG: ABC transporter ATP-binding protein, partial [Proteobacteria bacterium]|nr:ABC transporter ATP-binding protein [Pseudomonadota bacterium]